jgi:hypothetical protein
VFYEGDIKVLPRLRNSKTGLPSLFSLQVMGLTQGEGGEYPADAQDKEVQRFAADDLTEMHDKVDIIGFTAPVSPSRARLTDFFAW